MKTLVFILCFFSVTLFPNTPAEYYVSPTGNDNNPGTYARPFATVNKAFMQIPADTNSVSGVNIYILPGQYDQYVSINKSGSSNHPITIKAYVENSKPVFDASDESVFAKTDAVFRWSNMYDYIIIDGIILRNVTANDNINGIWIRGDHNIIRNCELYKIKRSGIVVQGSYNLIDHNVIDGIIGSSDHKKRGNSISIESYYKAPNTRKNCEYNIIQYNRISNNLTHFGINIFPATDDPDQPLMRGNEILNNNVVNTGGGVYTRYQSDLVIKGNTFANSVEDISWGAPGGGITFDKNPKFNPYQIPYDGGVIKISDNTISNNAVYGIKNYNVNSVNLKNNTFIDSLSDDPKRVYVSFSFKKEDIKADVDNNSYYGHSHWRWGVGTDQNSFEDWKKESGQDKKGKNSPDKHKK